MKRLALHIGILALTFVVGTYANALVLGAAYYFIPDVDPQPRASVIISCFAYVFNRAV